MWFRDIELKTRDWMHKHATQPKAQLWLFLVAFFEASVFPFPPSAFLITMISLGNKKKWFYLSLLTTVASVLGGILGYFLGSILYDTVGVWIVNQYGLADEIAKVGEMFSGNAFWSVFIGAFTPIPYRAFSIGGGFFSISLATFTFASFVGRGLRFFILGYLAKLFGKHVAERIFGFFTLVLALFFLFIVIFVLWSSF